MKKFFISFCVLICAVIFCACKTNQTISVINDNELYIINIPKNIILEPFVVDNLMTNKKVFEDNKFQLSMNAGYFDTVNKQTTSYVTIDGKEILNPTNNKNLINNPKLQANMDKILNRSELRYISCPEGDKYVIQKHFTQVNEECTLIHAIQAGPELLPNMDLEEEFFVSKNENGEIIRDPIGINRKVPRIAVGINPDNSLTIFVATKKHPMDLKNLAEYMKDKGCTNAINFDGGGSVSLNYKDIDIFSDYKNSRRPVKSFLVVK